MTHTPGPWTWSGPHDDYDALRGADNYVLMAVWHNDSTAGIGCENEADARLIAAAPELLETLRDLVRVIEADELIAGSVSYMRRATALLDCLEKQTDLPGVK